MRFQWARFAVLAIASSSILVAFQNCGSPQTIKNLSSTSTLKSATDSSTTPTSGQFPSVIHVPINGELNSYPIPSLNYSFSVNYSYMSSTQASYEGSSTALNIYGTEGDDNITGSNYGDVISAGGGNDIIAGYQGNDLINGNMGNDTIFGGQGDDVLYGGQGDDIIYGDRGNDIILGGKGTNILYGANVTHDLTSENGNDVFIFGGRGERSTIVDHAGVNALYCQDLDTGSDLSDTPVSVTLNGNDLVIDFGIVGHVEINDFVHHPFKVIRCGQLQHYLP